MNTSFSLFLLLTITLLAFTGYSQTGILAQEIEIKAGEYRLTTILRKLQNQQIPLAYSSDMIPKVNCIIDHDTQSIGDLLAFLESQVNFKHSVKEGLIVLSFGTKNPFNTLRGYVRDRATGEALIGAIIYKPDTYQGVITNNYGYFSLSLAPGFHTIRVNYTGYKPYEEKIDLRKGGYIPIITLEESISELDAVVVSSKEPDLNVTSLVPGFNTIDLNTKGVLPYFLGEVDVLQGATLLPGISTLGEDANGLFVRGGNSDQNLILLDEATIYNPSHLFGLISIFNPQAINNVEIMKGFIPAWYGGRASSIMSIHQKDGDDQQFHLTGGIGLVSAKFIAEGPLKKEESSFILSGRNSLLNLSFDENVSSRFRDLNGKVNWKINKQNTFYFSGYWGADRNTNVLDTESQWGNRNFSLRWNHLFGKRVFANFSAILSEYNYRITQPREAASFIGQSKIIDYTAKSDFGFIINPRNELRFGGNSTLHVLRPGSRVPFDEESSSANIIELDSEHGLENAFYVSHQVKVSSRFELLYGLRLSNLYSFGTDTVYSYASDRPKSTSSIIDTSYFAPREQVNNYWNLEPRISMNFQLSRQSSIKASYTKSNQYLHLISNTVTPSPTDIWKLSDQFIKPTSTDHYSLGYYQNLSNNKYEAYVDVYYKSLQHQIEYKDGADLLFNKNPETELLSGSGRSYGMELFFKKNEGNLTGWISYTLAQSESRVSSDFSEETINNGNYFPANWDKRHNLTLVGIYQLSRRLSSSLTFNFNTGRPYSLPQGQYIFEDNIVPYFGERNQDRLPNYHRLDLSVKWSGRTKKRSGETRLWRDYWTFVLYNAYGRDNVYSYLFEQDEETGLTKIQPNTIFDTMIPAITYNFKF